MGRQPPTAANHSKAESAIDHFAIGFAPLSLEQVYGLANDPRNGAIILMSGTVRNQTDGQAVASLEYQAYEPMAIKVFQAIAQQIRQQWPEVNQVVIHHRVGQLGPCEISVLVAVGCPHRKTGFQACQYAIDNLKHHAPIWKKEHWANGSSSWVNIGACEAQEPNKSLGLFSSDQDKPHPSEAKPL
ncbi:MAG: molybdenum cofactor biosynthesis protein MoaE [Acaryochloridaceae cyanobacterium SU_2_1]|nr:molybdenum cofactor biosynthesis protein MoaE [Acaryochloridaceae cyanobacterium SU_2_1]NJM95216.1 molybdenum cofactor biosynthesis protein MoaE [Acaryochloridaceae cyanobacterium CSU_5_19]